jgi:hypothetical protein
MNIYITRNGQQLGPFTDSDLREKIASGQFTPNDLGWYEGMADWQPLSILMASVPQSNNDSSSHRFVLATISFIFAITTAALWIFLNVLFAATHGFRHVREIEGLLIFLIILCIMMNIAGLVFGIIGTAKQGVSNKWMAVVGMIVNTLGFFAIAGLID